jgi:hypothetical protein
VQYALRGLAGLGLIAPSDPDILAAHIMTCESKKRSTAR